MFKRVSLFLLINFLVIISVSVITNALGLTPYLTRHGIDYTALGAFCLVWGMTGSIISLLMSRWTAKKLYGMGLIHPNTQNAGERTVLTMVYSAARRSGITTMPEVGVYESTDINAFATGPTKNRALVALSTGLLNNMNEDQVEGVISHEVSHIGNGDMVTMTLLQGLVNSFVMFLSRAIAYGISQNGRDERRTGGYILYYVIQFILEIILMFLGSIVVAYYSRLREYAADKGGARLAGKEKMIGALKVLQSQHNLGPDTIPAASDRFKIFQISNPSRLAFLFSTHPSLDNRIKRLQKMKI